MDKIEKHTLMAHAIITEIYDRYIEGDNSGHYILAMDETTRNYLLIMNTWIKSSRFYGILIHIQVMENGLIYLHDDNTDLIVVDWFLERGVAKKDIVLGWHMPSMRPDTEFAVA